MANERSGANHPASKVPSAVIKQMRIAYARGEGTMTDMWREYAPDASFYAVRDWLGYRNRLEPEAMPRGVKPPKKTRRYRLVTADE